MHVPDDVLDIFGYYSFDVTIPSGSVQSVVVLSNLLFYTDGTGATVVIHAGKFTYHPPGSPALPQRASFNFL